MRSCLYVGAPLAWLWATALPSTASDSQLKSGLPRGFSARIWKEDSSINGGLPYLVANRPRS